MKFSALSLFTFVSAAYAQTVTVTSLDTSQAQEVSTSIASYESSIAPSLSSVLYEAGSYIITGTDTEATIPFTDLLDGYYTFDEADGYSSATALLNDIITSSVDAEGALQTFADFIQSAASVEASIINHVGAAPGSALGMGVLVMAMIAAGVAVVLM